MTNAHSGPEDQLQASYWRRWYLLVIILHLLVIVLLYCVTRWFHPTI